LAVSMATAAILKKSTLESTTSHGIWYSYLCMPPIISIIVLNCLPLVGS
jgi:hypothetical protein